MTADPGMDQSTQDQAKAAASTAADEGQKVAGVTREETSRVTSEAAAQAKSVAGDARDQITEQVGQQTRQSRDRLVGTLGSLSGDLDSMADNSTGNGLATDIAREVAGHARSLGDYLDGREPTELLDDVRDFARRRPGVFLAGALVAGIVAGRVARGVKDAGGDDSTASATPTPTSAPAHLAAGGYDDLGDSAYTTPSPYADPAPVPVVPATTDPTLPGEPDGFGSDPLTAGTIAGGGSPGTI